MSEHLLDNNTYILLLKNYNLLKKSVEFYKANAENTAVRNEIQQLLLEYGIDDDYDAVCMKTELIIGAIDKGIEYANTINPLSSIIIRQTYINNDNNYVSVARMVSLSESTMYYNQKKCLMYALRGTNTMLNKHFMLTNMYPLYPDVSYLRNCSNVLSSVEESYISLYSPVIHKSVKKKLSDIGKLSPVKSVYDKYYFPLMILLVGYNALRCKGIYIETYI